MDDEAGRVFTDKEWLELMGILSLSERQGQIAHRMFRDMSDYQISQDLKIAVPTVRTHISRLFGKLGVDDRVGLVLHVVGRFRDECRKLDCPRNR